LYDLASPDDDKALLGVVAVRHAQGRMEEATVLWHGFHARNKKYIDLELVQRAFRTDHPRVDLLVVGVHKLVAKLPPLPVD
jgi:hypothetical protein